jgi:hypothetical protein
MVKITVANEYAKAIIDKFQGKEIVYYGLDAAWCRSDAANSTPPFQFSFPEEEAVLLDVRLVVMCLGLDSLECT